MKSLIYLLTVIAALSLDAAEPWKFRAFSNEEKIRLHMDLYQETIEVPGMEMFGSQNGYMSGDIYGVWTITSFNIQNSKEAVINVSNDLGSETQKILLTLTSDSTLSARLEGAAVMKRVVGKKLVKIPTTFNFMITHN